MSESSGDSTRRDLNAKHGILFVCVANSARSQMAEGLARAFGGDQLRAQSAGAFATEIHPMAIEVMGELGIELTGQRSKAIDEIDPSTVDTVVTLCSKQHCPVFVGEVTRLDWEQEDPVGATSEETRKVFRRIRDQIAANLREWMAEQGMTVAKG